MWRLMCLFALIEIIPCLSSQLFFYTSGLVFGVMDFVRPSHDFLSIILQINSTQPYFTAF